MMAFVVSLPVIHMCFRVFQNGRSIAEQEESSSYVGLRPWYMSFTDKMIKADITEDNFRILQIGTCDKFNAAIDSFEFCA